MAAILRRLNMRTFAAPNTSSLWVIVAVAITAYPPPLCGLSHQLGTQYHWPSERFRADDYCPVDPPCHCDHRVRDYRVKRIICSPDDFIQTASQADDINARRERKAGRFPRFQRRTAGEKNEVLHELSLIFAELGEIPNSAFQNVKALSLDLQGNNFGDRIQPKAFSGVSKALKSINLAWSNISSVNPRVFRGMILLQNLTLAENKIRQLSSYTFQDLRSLQRLSLAGNSLHELPGDIFRYQTNLEMLDLGYCHLGHIPWNLFLGLWNLKVLDLRGNKITSLDSYTFLDMWSLHTLLLGHNMIRRLRSGVFFGINHLVVLKLQASNIQSISPRVFRQMTHLRLLDLSDNRISVLSRGTFILPSLEHLNLDGNRLKDLPVDVNYLPSLVSLDLSYNYIATLDSCSFDRFKELELLNLRQNPFVCDCSIFWLRRLRRILMKKWRDHSQRIPFVPGHCSSPRELAGVPVSSWLNIDCMKTDETLPSQSQDATSSAAASHRRHARHRGSSWKRSYRSYGDMTTAPADPGQTNNKDLCRKDDSFYSNVLGQKDRSLRHLPYPDRQYYYDPFS